MSFRDSPSRPLPRSHPYSFTDIPVVALELQISARARYPVLFVSPFAREASGEFAPSPSSTACRSAQSGRAHPRARARSVPPLFRSLVLRRFLILFASARLELFDTSSCAQVSFTHTILFRRVSTTIDRSADSLPASSAVHTKCACHLGQRPLDARTSSTASKYRFVNFRGSQIPSETADEWSARFASSVSIGQETGGTVSPNRPADPALLKRCAQSGDQQHSDNTHPSGMLGRPCFFAVIRRSIFDSTNESNSSSRSTRSSSS